MPTPRRAIVDPSVSGVYHCQSRCVRRAFLCGHDRYSGRNYEHRREWVRDRLQELATLFAVEVHAYSVMSNHLHIVVRTQPGWVKGWSDEEVARRWLWLFPGPGGTPGQPADPAAIFSLCHDPRRLALRRERLADLSWFMRCLNEHIARRANAEDECTGRFWEARFNAEKLTDEGAALACMSYVDLNPVRAGMAESLEASDFTSAQDRLVACRARRQLDELPDLDELASEQAELIAQARLDAQRDTWLAPIGPLLSECAERPPSLAPIGEQDRVEAREKKREKYRQEIASPRVPTETPAPSPVPVPPPSPGFRPAPLLTELSAERYLDLIDWTGREIRAGKRGRVSPELAPVLERLELDVETWVENVERYAGLFYCLAAKIEGLRQAAVSAGVSWFKGKQGARKLYRSAA